MGPLRLRFPLRSFQFLRRYFKGNSVNIGILPVTVSEAFLEKIFTAIEADPKTLLEVNLPAQTITLLATGEQESFDINGYKKNNLTHGYDDIDYLQAINEDISAFAAKSPY
jgi:3-isopropylmalate/(R)-2-methylmalate dehydratase small subunit